MEAELLREKILVHEGIMLFRESVWTTGQREQPALFLLTGLREKEILSAIQTSVETLSKDIEHFHTGLGLPLYTRLVGLYYQYQLADSD
jgi:hypothetical protein